MRSVNIAELKNQLSACLYRVRSGEELLVRDRNTPIAKIIPLAEDDLEADELSLVASGQMTLPRKPFDGHRFWAIGARSASRLNLRRAIRKAVNAEREEGNASVLGHKRHRSHLRARPSKQRG
jgi:prevent-host-death family protein